MHARRVESNLKTDWTLIPSQRNITTKWDALCGDRVACKHAVDREKAGSLLATELVTTAEGLYKRLQNGYWLDSKGLKRSINKDLDASFRIISFTNRFLCISGQNNPHKSLARKYR